MALTKKQRQILDYVESFVEANGYSPTLEVIADHFGYHSLATVHEHISNLERKGHIRRNRGRIELVRTEPRVGTAELELPLRGCVAAGQPIEVIPGAEQETITFHDMGRRGESYVLRVRGDSMIDEQIRDGDYIVVNERPTAENGAMVVARVSDGTPGGSATLKKFYRERGGRIRLQPANAAMDPMYFRDDEVAIQGIVVGVIRKY